MIDPEGTPQGINTSVRKVVDMGRHLPRAKPSEDFHSLIGIGIGEAAANAGLKAAIKIPNGKGPYIMHIGQTHPHLLDEGVTFIMERDIINSQKKIEAFLLELQKTNPEINKVFAEGYSNRDIELIAHIREMQENLQNNPDFQPANPESLGNLVYYYLTTNEKLAKAFPSDKRIVIYGFDYIARKRLMELRRHFQENPPSMGNDDADILKTDLDQASAILDSPFVFGVSQQSFGEDIAYILGAALKMYLDGTLEAIYPTMSVEADKETAPLLQQLGEIEKQMATLGRHDIKRRLPLVLKKVLVQKKYTEKAYRDREDIAVNRVTERPEIKSMKVIPLIFGKNHEFDSSVKSHNEQHGESTVGLIKVS